MSRPLLLLLGAGMLLPGAGLLGERAWLEAKACLASRLIERAFGAHLRDGGIHRPWSWADTWPVARLEVPRLGVRRVVLEGATGGTLAFGLGRLSESAEPNGPGRCVLAGHRDGSAGFLGELRVGDRLSLHTREGRRHYRVEELVVIHERDASVLVPSEGRGLTLITCYPLRGLRPGPWRLSVECREEGSALRGPSSGRASGRGVPRRVAGEG
jgi:sortase A